MKDVKGKVAVVTGAASGIGRGMCETFVQAGMRVVLSDVEEKALARTTAVLRDAGAWWRSRRAYLELRQGGYKPGISVLCPGFADTNILESERNRPADLPDASPLPTGPVFEVFREWS